jgi:glycosyltransferase involved in cell wall biosynthesis
MNQKRMRTEPDSPLVSVLTVTFNRAALLARLYNSLTLQTFRDFEWVIVDDGSTDETAEVVASLAAESAFTVRRIYQENIGRTLGLDRGYADCRGRFTAVIDDDDWYVPDALERLVHLWEQIREPELYAEVQGLTAYPNGTVIGDPYPADVFDSDHFEIRESLRLRGDRLGMFRTSVLREFPAPPGFEGINVPSALIFNRMAKHYRCLGVNAIIGHKEYLPDGITRSKLRAHAALSGPRLMYLEEMLGQGKDRPLPAKHRYKSYANLIRNALHQRRSLARVALDAPSRVWLLGALPVGLSVYARDRVKAKR